MPPPSLATSFAGQYGADHLAVLRAGIGGVTRTGQPYIEHEGVNMTLSQRLSRLAADDWKSA
jgi:hypothetical protein